MVDAQRAGVAHVGAQRLDEAAVARLAQPSRRERRQPPVLTVGLKSSGGAPTLAPAHDAPAVGPGVGAAAVDRRPRGRGTGRGACRRRVGRARRLAELLVGQPLQPRVEADPSACAAANSATRRCRDRGTASGQRGPVPRAGSSRGSARAAPRSAPAAQALAAVAAGRRAKARPRARARRARCRSRNARTAAQDRQLERGHAGVVDEVGVARGGKLRLERRRRDQRVRARRSPPAPATASTSM